MKARLNAEFEAKKRVDKMNILAEKHKTKELKAQEALTEL
jgi:hypothetical protein